MCLSRLSERRSSLQTLRVCDVDFAGAVHASSVNTKEFQDKFHDIKCAGIEFFYNNVKQRGRCVQSILLVIL